ncbi:MAG: gamma-glutamylputrescine oxidase, partial [Candidatus Binatota bacterium]|nr:gamma-glutamylputrescine oxidase [Candidatus Binatota bacterium]
MPLLERADVAVAGGGFTGLSAALALARGGARVVLLEAARIGAGASGRTGGLVLEGTAAGPLPDADRCVAGLAELVASTGIDCDLRLDGCLELRHDPVRGFWRDGSAYLDVEQSVEGGTLDPGALVAGLARAAVDAGAQVHEETPVTAVEAGSPLVVRSGDRAVRAGAVVVALNAYVSPLPPSRRSVHPALTMAVATEPLDDAAAHALGAAAELPFYTVDLPYLWGRRLASGGMVFGSGLAFDATDDLTRISLTGEDPVNALERLIARVRDLHPALARTRIAHRWAGPIAFTDDRR